MELKQGTKLKVHRIDDKLVIEIDEGPSWLAGPGGLLFATLQEDGSYIVGSIIKEQGPAVAMGYANAFGQIPRILNQWEYSEKEIEEFNSKSRVDKAG